MARLPHRIKYGSKISQIQNTRGGTLNASAAVPTPTILQPQNIVLPQRVTCVGGSLSCRLLLGVCCHTKFLERVPLSTGRTFTYPVRRLLPTIGANIRYLVFCHTIIQIITPQNYKYFSWLQNFLVLLPHF